MNLKVNNEFINSTIETKSQIQKEVYILNFIIKNKL